MRLLVATVVVVAGVLASGAPAWRGETDVGKFALELDSLSLLEPENQVQLGEGVGVKGNPVAENPAPRDFFKLPNVRQGGAMVLCEGFYSMDAPTGNLKQCAEMCSERCNGLCKGFVYTDAGSGKCLWKSQVPSDLCPPPTCNQDSYGKCPPGRWSDGISQDENCYQPPTGYAKTVGDQNCDTGGTDIACNEGGSVLHTSDRNLDQCGTMCNACAVGEAKCKGFVAFTRSSNETSCRFKSVIPENVPVNKDEDLYTKCPDGTWSDGVMKTCEKAPKNFHPIPRMDGGSDIACNAGNKYESYKKDGNYTLEDCGKTCSSCKIGQKKCAGFIRREDGYCNFKTNDGGALGQKVDFASTASVNRDAFAKCPENKVSSGTSACIYPDDWKVRVVSGIGTDCSCNNRPVENRSMTSATWTFDVFSDVISIFVANKPHVVAPCPNKTSLDCLGADDTSFRTSAGGALPSSVRISVDQNDGWCMKKFCLSSAKLGRKYVTSAPKWMNPGDADDGACLPPTADDEHSNWGWCRFLAPNVTSTAENCNVLKSFRQAFWEMPLEDVSQKSDESSWC